MVASGEHLGCLDDSRVGIHAVGRHVCILDPKVVVVVPGQVSGIVSPVAAFGDVLKLFRGEADVGDLRFDLRDPS